MSRITSSRQYGPPLSAFSLPRAFCSPGNSAGGSSFAERRDRAERTEGPVYPEKPAEGAEAAAEALTEGEALQNFAVLGLDAALCRAVREMGFDAPSPIQEQAIPPVLEGKDLIGQAQTGTGKTAAFGLPILQRIDPKKRCPQAMILCPTRELASQVSDELHRYAKYLFGVRILPVY